jgi:3-hydroxyacyl-[acyl-carrier-protein] dehydratase
MLKDSLYTLEKIDSLDAQINAQVKLNAQHPIFKGHFPDIPVLPGVAMMQMIKDILEFQEEQDLQISKAGNMKFLQMVNPEKTELLDIVINITERNEEYLKIKAQINAETTICFKMTAQLAFK